MRQKRILFIFGTRPEAIKMAPLIKEFEKNKKEFKVGTCVTAQHRELLDQILNFFEMEPDYDLNIMTPNQSLFNLTARIIGSLENVLDDFNPDLVFVQGDTTTAFVGALASYYKKIQVAHLEAGLRSNNKYAPFPEEINRVLIGHIADYHFAPTQKAEINLYDEGIKKNVWVVGNTVIDALFLTLDIIKKEGEEKYYDFFNFVDFSKKIILVTCHRRESFGKPFEDICYAIKEIAHNFEDVEVIYPVHLNVNVRNPVFKILKGSPRIHLINPLSYPQLIWLLSKAYIVLTDSGGIQEEAPSLGKPVLVLRDVTERIEAIEAGTAKLVGTDPSRVVSETAQLLNDLNEYNRMARSVNPYGDGKASYRIRTIIQKIMNEKKDF